MSNSFGVEIPRIVNEEVFENLCLDLVWKNSKYENSNRNGRRGQRQNGVDIFARERESLNWIGVQCKVKANGAITNNEIKHEIKIALGFNPQLSKLFFYTTAKRDESIQSFIRSEADHHLANRLFDIDILFWNDIEDMLKDEEYTLVHYKYYRDLYTHIEDDGFYFGKLIRLTVGYRIEDTDYELLIGKTFQKGSDSYMNINYWKNVYYIMNFHERTFETFPLPCHESDLEAAFKYRRDRYIITKFINSIPNMDKFIKSTESEFKFILTDQEFQDFLSAYKEE
ncbi:hypothetical protein [Peribacillus frigoritolerans]|uniref:hypothetical protein n=1 Tax=Peribacillus frigoritolerans TaxID=450367 RepID=UPI00105A56B7|nr:hypothetical protein [Peribacillus frigoritolerans]TDL83211.1 hypothetical protein E2R53_06710 [Peribacillus frigoritolerans]